jgi:fumarate reductase subunit D
MNRSTGPMKRSTEPPFWLLFGAGGVLSAVFGPVLVLITGLAGPFGILVPRDTLDYAHALVFAQSLIGKVILCAVIMLFLFHGVHRLYHSLHDVGLHPPPLARCLCYASAATASALAAILLLAVGF